MDYIEQLRNKRLIEEREEYEANFFSIVVDEMFENDYLDKLIAERMNFIEDSFDFEPSAEYEQLEELYYSQNEHVESYDDGDGFIRTYSPGEDPFDKIPDIDYPDGPSENIGGTINQFDMPSEFQDDFDFEDRYLDFVDEMAACSGQECMYDYNDYLEDVVTDLYEEELLKEEQHLEELIQEHLEEEEYLNNCLKQTIREHCFFEKSIDKYILENVGIDFDDVFIDYRISDTDGDKIDSAFKEYFRKNEVLNEIVGEKIEKKLKK